MKVRLHHLLMAVIGGVAILDGQRIASHFRDQGMFGVVGPDRYLMGLGTAMLVLFLAAILTPEGELAPQPAPFDDVVSEGSGNGARRLLLCTIGYVCLVPLFGYSLATLLFLGLAFFLGGVRPLWRTLAACALATSVFYAVFVMLIDLQFPKPFFGLS